MSAQTMQTEKTPEYWLAHYQGQGYSVQWFLADTWCLTIKTKTGGTRFIYVHTDGSVTS